MGIYRKLITNIILNSEKLNVLLLRSGTRQECPFSPFLVNIVMELLSRCN